MKLKKYIRIWVILVIFSVVTASAAQAAELGTRTLKNGMSGDDVSKLQQLLKQIGYFKSDVTGYYGSVTTSSVKSFQKAYGLTGDGVAGPETIYKIRYENGIAADSLVSTRALKKGMRGVDVQNLQEVLKRLGYLPSSLKTTQYFGDQTLSAVRSFQKKAGLAVDGSVGPATKAAINKALAKLINEKSSGSTGSSGKNSSSSNSSTGSTSSSGNNTSSGGTGSNSSTNNTASSGQVYTVQAGDTLWLISQRYNTTVEKIQQANSLNTSTIYPGQRLNIPTSKEGSNNTADDKQAVTVTYEKYTVKAGDTIWSIAYAHSIPQNELMQVNNFNVNTILDVGQVIKVPVYHVPVKSTPGSQYGELLDWWTEAQYVLLFNEPFTITDFYTGKSFKAVRTFGANHADCEPLTAADTAAIRKLWNQYHTSYWTTRPVIITINGRRLAASMSAMMHAGVDSEPNAAYVDNRSGDYGYGQNYDAIKGNDADGHFDIHFLNSTTHATGNINKNHQANVKIAAGIK